ncbi:hypothetical protein M0802_013192 [Mischocyttarus mexicanus]|nr:hypothetical protein M0802_013192 [Mischocyttarus mexicanus]
MGQVKKYVFYDYWSTDRSIETPFFSQVMSRNRFMQIMQSWHFCNNDNIPHNAHKLAKIQPVIDYLQRKFNDVYKPDQQLSLDECIIPWRGRLSIKTYNLAKITKYGILLRILCEAVTGYICNFHVYAADGKKLEDMVLTNFLHKVALSWIDDKTNCMEQDGDVSSSAPTRRVPKLDNPGRLSNFGKHKLLNIVTSGRSVKSQRQCRVCAVQKKRSRTCFVCKFCNVPLHKDYGIIT